MATEFQTAQVLMDGVVSRLPVRIYAGVLGQIGDIVMFSATLRRLRQLFPNGRTTCAVSRQYQQAGELLLGLPYVDRLFVTSCYFEKMTEALSIAWHAGWPVDLRGEDEVLEQRRHDIVLQTRPRHRRMPWWEFAHQVEELAHSVGVPGPIDLRTEIAIPEETVIPQAASQRIVMHNDPAIDLTKTWSWTDALEVAEHFGADRMVLLGSPGPAIPGALDLRGQTTLAQAAAIIATSQCYVGIDSGLMWIAGSLQVPCVGLYGTSYVPVCNAVQPLNPRATYLQAEGAARGIPAREVIAAVERIVGLADGGAAASGVASSPPQTESGYREP